MESVPNSKPYPKELRDQAVALVLEWRRERNRTDGGLNTRLRNWRVVVLDENRKELFSKKMADPFEKNMKLGLTNMKTVKLQNATAEKLLKALAQLLLYQRYHRLAIHRW